jgi:CheY-like chemotaxis protein
LAAVEQVEDKEYDAVLVDYRIPEMDGLAFARVVGDILGPLARPVLIALTAAPERIIDRESGEKSAFDLVVDKSCGLMTLILQINNLIGKAPGHSTRQAFMHSFYRRAEEDYLFGPRPQDIGAEDRSEIHILVVEDHDLQRCLLTDILEKRGYVVEAVANGLDASRSIRDHGYDLVIVDYFVPELDGVAVASLVHRHMAQALRPRLIGYTASPDLLSDRIATSGLVFDEIVDKSNDVQELLSAVDRLLRSSPNPTTRRLASAAYS